MDHNPIDSYPIPTGRQPWDCVHNRVARQAAADADALALASGQRWVSHGELDRWANRIGHTLRALGIGRDQVVAVSADVSPELVAGELGVLRAGAACLPLHPDTPPSRLVALLDALGVEVVLARWEQAARFPTRVRLLDLDGGFDDAPSHDPMCGAVPDDLAFVFDRSGPDAELVPVMIPHAAVVNLVDSASGAHRPTATDRVALAALPSYEASMLEIWPALIAGASLHAPGRGPDADWLVEHRITVAFLPAASAGRIIARLAGTPGAIRTVTVVGRVFDGPIPDSPFEIRYLTGPEEGGVVSIQAGRPGANTEAYLLDHGGRPVPPGVAGELCVAGACLARGVVGRPALTADRFRPHPFSATPGARIYHSGAAARHTPGGRVEFLGQHGTAAPGGTQPDPAMIEAALRRHPSIADAAVLVTEAGRGAQQVAVFATARSGGEVPPDEIRHTVADLLAPRAIPVEVQAVAELPATPSGRLDTQALLDRVEDGTGAVTTTARPDHAPETRLATLVAQVWADVLGCGEPGRAALLSGVADFFELGGHSMFAIAAALRLSGELDVSIPARLIFEAPTVPAFIGRLEKLLAAGTSLRTTKITPLPRD
jgi:acyl-CoA synthetase (AMP-forming)/AMP-acid ligase II